jgi:cysteine dioxygenase
MLETSREEVAMIARNKSTRLEELWAYLDGLTSRADMHTLARLLQQLDISADDVADCVRFNETTYQRNVLREGENYHALVICWRSGQRSPIHNHARSVCGFRVLAGVATETVFDWTPSGLLKPTATRDHAVGTIVASKDADVHQVSNLQAPGEDLVTLHIYSPPLMKMDTYSLMDRQVSEFRPVFVEHYAGSGI